MASQERAPSENLTPKRSGGVPPVGMTATVFHGIEQREDRGLILALLKFMGENAPGEPLVDVVQVPIAALMADPAIRAMLADGDPAGAVRKVANIDVQEIFPPEGQLAVFAASQLFDAVEIWKESASPSEPRQLIGWQIRCGQWAWWCLSSFERAAICRLAGACLLAGNDAVARLVVGLGTTLLEQAGAAGVKNQVLSLADGEALCRGLVPCVDRTSMLAILMEAFQVLESGRVVARVTYPGPQGHSVMVGEVMPMHRFRGPAPLKMIQID